MSLREEGIKHREGAITQALTGIRQNLETLEVIGFRTLDHPLAGLATEIEGFHRAIIGAEKTHAEYMTKKMAPVIAAAHGIDQPAVPGNVTEGKFGGQE